MGPRCDALETDNAAESSRVPTAILVATAFMGAVSPFATDLYLPAFPELARELDASTTGVQLTLTAFLIGAALGQGVLGPLSDRLGRRAPLIAGAALCCIASLVAVLAPTLSVLVAARFVQGAAGAAGMVIGRAVIADLVTGAAAARSFSVMMSIAGVAPIGAPVIGGLLADPIGWRGIFLMVFALTLGVLAVALLVIPETLPPRRRARLRRDRRRTGGSTGSALLSREFLGYAAVSAFGFAALLAYVSASPFLYQGLLGMSASGYGVMFAVNSVVLIAMTFLSSRLAGRLTARTLVGIGLTVMVFTGAALFAVWVFGSPPAILAVLLPMMLGGFGFVQGNAVAAALSAAPYATGTASAVIGFAQFALSGASAALVSIDGIDPVLSLAVVLASTTGCASVGYLVTGRPNRRRALRPDDEPTREGSSPISDAR